jgi:hypothetical protein
MIKIKDSLKKLIGRIIKMAAFLTAIGSLFIPLAIVLDIEIPKTPHWGIYVMVITGFICLILGAINVIKEERQRRNEMFLFALFVEAIADKQGVKTTEVMRKWEEITSGKSKRIKTKQESKQESNPDSPDNDFE